MERRDLAEFGTKASQIMIFLPHYMWAENNNNILNFKKIERLVRHLPQKKGEFPNSRNPKEQKNLSQTAEYWSMLQFDLLKFEIESNFLS